jgi:glycerophosphoryl diester phosphodiesterase
LDADQLQALSLKGTDQTIPTFRQVLELVNGRTPLLVELKGETLNVELCEKVAALLKDYPGTYCMESFNPLLVRKIRKLLPNVPCGQLYTNMCRRGKKKSIRNLLLSGMAFNFLAKPHFIAYNKKDRNFFPVRLSTKLYHAPRFVWTTKNEEELATARELGECAIFERSEEA